MSRSMRIGSITVTVAAAAFFVLDIIGALDRWPAAGRGVHDGAVVTPVVAVMCWLIAFARRGYDARIAGISGAYRRREAVLIEAVSRPDAPTLPLPRLHSIHS